MNSQLASSIYGVESGGTVGQFEQTIRTSFHIQPCRHLEFYLNRTFT